jgi:hypothetical protein
VKERKQERISPEEYERINQVAAQARRLMEAALGLASALRPAVRESSPRGQVRSRLDCVTHDFIAPMVRDLGAITDLAARFLEDERQGA